MGGSGGEREEEWDAPGPEVRVLFTNYVLQRMSAYHVCDARRLQADGHDGNSKL